MESSKEILYKVSVMDNFVIRHYVHKDRHVVVDLWRRCGLVVTQNDPYLDIERKIDAAASPPE